MNNRLLYLYNANIRTLDPNHPQVSEICIIDETIWAVGSDAQKIAAEFFHVEKMDMQGRTIWPGLVDAHIHLQHYALGLQHVDCETATRQECLERVARRVTETPLGEWVRGHGWNQNQWEDGFGNRELLDQIAPRHPVYLTAKSLHAAWANSEALFRAGITHNTPDPEGGSIQRDAQGTPTGILFEAAMQLVEKVIAPPSQTTILNAIEIAQQNLWQMGITGLHDYDHRACFEALQILRERNLLHLRVVKGIPLEDLQHAIGLGLRSGFGDDYLRMGHLKLFADGALGPQTAAMLAPYENNPHSNGMLLMDKEQILEIGQQASQNGIALAVHAIGDRANHEVIEAINELRHYEQKHQLPGLRHRIEHVQVLHPDDLHRLAQAGIIASMQPIHAPSDMYMADQHWGSRARYAYAWNTLTQQGTKLAFGSDAPVESPNPFLGLHAAVTRRRTDGSPGETGWFSEERISLVQALHGYTDGAAYAAGIESRSGALTAGYLADLIVLPVDPFKLSAQEIHLVKPDATMIGGKWVWRNQ